MHFSTSALLFLLGITLQVDASPYYPLQRSQREVPVPRSIGAKRDFVFGRPPSYSPNATRANAVKETFQIAWDGYYTYAFPNDILLPVTNGYENQLNGWGASAVDALSTALVQENYEVVCQILKYIPEIDFTNTTTEISLFETTIRYLGGLLSAYDLANGPLKHLVNDTKLVPKLLEQAVVLADGLKVAFDTPTGIPDNSVFFDPPRRGNSTSNGIATIGTLILEWTRLSDLTDDPTYGELAKKGESYLIDVLNPEVGEPFPGLLGTDVSISNGTFLNSGGGWNGGDDSFYEYLIKAYIYDPIQFAEYKERWVLAADSSIQYLASTPTRNESLTFLAAYDNNKTLSFVSTHLACFDGGNFILGGLTLQVKEYVEFGLALVDACYDTYSKTATGIGPEVFRWQDSNTPINASNNAGPPTANDTAFYQEAGFWITDAVYALRPEVLESIYYAYRATGDTKYQDWAWEGYLAINRTTRVGSGYSDISNVNTPGGGEFLDFQESFFFAEVLKYAYIIHAEDATWQVQADRTNQFVFNTEAHPLRIQAGYEKPWLETR